MSRGGCDQCDGPECGDGCDFGYELFDGRCHRWLRDLSVFVGGDAFKGPLDRGTNGNFGLNEGLNLAGPLGDPWGCGYQIGANFVQSNFSAHRRSPRQTTRSSLPAAGRPSSRRESSAALFVPAFSGAWPSTTCTTTTTRCPT